MFFESIRNEFRDLDHKRFIENLTSLSVLQGINFLLGLAILPYLVRILGAERFGQVMFAHAAILYFVIVFDYGFNLSAVRQISIHRQNGEKISEIFSSMMMLKAFFIVLGFLILIFLIAVFDKFRSLSTLLIVSYGLVIGRFIFPVWFFQGLEKMKIITVLNTLARSIFVAAVFVFVEESSDYLLVPFLNALGFAAAGGISLIVIARSRRARFVIPPLSAVYGYFKEGSHYMFSQAGTMLYTNSNIFFVGLFVSDAMVGLFAAAERLFQALLTAYSPLADSLYPFMSHKRDMHFFKRVFAVSSAANILLCFVIFIFAGSIIDLLYGPGYEVSIGVLKIFSLACILILPALLMGYPLLAAFGRQREANYSNLGVSILHLILLAVIAPLGNLNLVAGIMIVTQAALIIVRTYFACRIPGFGIFPDSGPKKTS